MQRCQPLDIYKYHQAPLSNYSDWLNGKKDCFTGLSTVSHLVSLKSWNFICLALWPMRLRHQENKDIWLWSQKDQLPLKML